MRQHGMAFLSMLSTLALLSACGHTQPQMSSNPIPPTPPAVETSRGQEIPVVQAGYEWDTGSRSVVADSPGPEVLLKNQVPNAVAAGETFTVQFTEQPLSVETSVWRRGQTGPFGGTVGNAFPSVSGTYDYEITAHWGKNNTASYDFTVTVNETQ